MAAILFRLHFFFQLVVEWQFIVMILVDLVYVTEFNEILTNTV